MGPARSHLALDLAGVLIPAATPFVEGSEELDLVSLRANVRRWLQSDVRGIVIAGSTGEAVYLDPEERKAALEAVRELVPEERLLVAGTGAEATRAAIRLTLEAARCGVDAVLVQPPAYYRGAMTPGVLRDHYVAVAEASPVPVILYQVPPRFATVELVTGLVAELSEHPNIVGVKDSRGDLALLGEYVTRTRPGFQVLVGNGAGFYAGLEVGAVGGILGVANLMPAAAAGIHRAFASGRPAEAGRLQERVGPLHREVVAALGVPGVKHALDLLGLGGGLPRRPLRPLGAKEAARVSQALRAAGLEVARRDS